MKRKDLFQQKVSTSLIIVASTFLPVRFILAPFIFSHRAHKGIIRPQRLYHRAAAATLFARSESGPAHGWSPFSRWTNFIDTMTIIMVTFCRFLKYYHMPGVLSPSLARLLFCWGPVPAEEWRTMTYFDFGSCLVRFWHLRAIVPPAPQPASAAKWLHSLAG